MNKFLLLMTVLATACGTTDDTKDSDSQELGSNFDCASDHSDDACIEMACQACVDACESDCQVEDLYPPQYSCGADYFLVEDFCPDWSAE